MLKLRTLIEQWIDAHLMWSWSSLQLDLEITDEEVEADLRFGQRELVLVPLLPMAEA